MFLDIPEPYRLEIVGEPPLAFAGWTAVRAAIRERFGRLYATPEAGAVVFTRRRRADHAPPVCVVRVEDGRPIELVRGRGRLA